MELEQFYVYDVTSSLTPDRRAIINKHVDDNSADFGKNVRSSWHKDDGEDVLRIFVDPVIIEIVFLGERVEVYGVAPQWARVLFTAERKAQLQEKIEEVLLGAGFVTPATLEAQRRPKRRLFARVRGRSAAP